MEDWSPIWDLTGDLYQNVTIDYIQDLYPGLFPDKNNSELLLRAMESWELNAMEVMLWGITVVRNVYPLAKIGYYGYPGMPYWCNDKTETCKQQKIYNDNMLDLWEQVDVLLPSIYMPYNSTGDLGVYIRNMEYVKRKVNEAERINKMFGRNHDIVVYTWHRYHDPPNDLISYNEFLIQYDYTYRFPEVDGLILWSNEGRIDWKNQTKWWFAEYSNMFEQLV